jgi:hypothetical protein
VKTAVQNVKLTDATYETTFLEVSDPHGNMVVFGPSRVTVEPIDFRRKSAAEKIADGMVRCLVTVVALYLLSEIFRAFADGAFKGLSN